MNGVHDMGGMHGMGPVVHETNEPVFHERWEGRVYGLSRAMGAVPGWRSSRYDIETLPPADYLRMSYYEKWFTRIVNIALKLGFVTPQELESGRTGSAVSRATPSLRPEMVRVRPGPPAGLRVDVQIAARFKAGQRVRARNLNPEGHTRLPRYARGKRGIIVKDHGVFVFPDTDVHGLGEKPQHQYTVRFGARELWGEQAPARDSVHVDMWEDYLERA
jgi:nitrile hydratase